MEAFDQTAQEITFHNYLDFTNAKDYIRIAYEINCDGKVTAQGEIGAVDIEPHSISTVKCPVDVPKKGRTFLKVSYYSTKGNALVPEGHLLGFDEIELCVSDNRNQDAVQMLEQNEKSGNAICVSENDTSVILKGGNFHYALDKRTGLFTKIEFNGIDQITRPMDVNIWRAPTDNDMYIKLEWYRARYDKAIVRCYDTQIEQTENGVNVHCHMSLASETVQRILDMDTVWNVSGNGAIELKMDVTRHPEFPMLPRFGLRLFLDRNMDQIKYYGMGPVESYCDKRRASYHGVFEASVENLHEDYIRPQENGSHYDCSYVVAGGENCSLAAVSEKAFSFNASVYTQEELTLKKHNFELEDSGNVVLCLDYAQNGIGSNSCGPVLKKEYRLDDDKFTFTMKLIFG